MAVPVQAIKAYSLVHSLTSALHAGQWSTSRPGRFTPGQDPQYPLNTWPGGSQNRSGRLEQREIFCTNSNPSSSTLQPSKDTDSTIPSQANHIEDYGQMKELFISMLFQLHRAESLRNSQFFTQRKKFSEFYGTRRCINYIMLHTALHSSLSQAS